MAWRWDQGRLDYFQFDTIKAIAKVLANLEGVRLAGPEDPLRKQLSSATGLPFAPSHYTVWRNYGRVFGCQLLASRVGNRLACTDLCRKISDNEISSADDYLAHIARRFYYPSPVFEGYGTASPQVFPFCAIIKRLFAKRSSGQPHFVTVREVIEKIVGNRCTGSEPIGRYQYLPNKDATIREGEARQIRELMRFMSQFSFLKWQNPKLFLDMDQFSDVDSADIEILATPVISRRNPDRSLELLALGKLLAGPPVKVPDSMGRIYNEDEEFLEGKKVRATHLRTERSRKLREIFFVLNEQYSCHMCGLDTRYKYPWTQNLLELHHLLPLSSPLRYEAKGTSVKDLVGLCPNCHRATHDFYRRWLRSREQDDFLTDAEARNVYDQAKSEVILK